MINELNCFNELHGITVPELLHKRAQDYPFKLALSAPSFRGYRDRVSFSQLVIRMDSVARGLAVRGLKKGERVALFLSNNEVRECVLTALGCYRLGAVVVPLNIHASDEELQHALDLTDPTFIVTLQPYTERLKALSSAQFLCLDGEPREQNTWPEPELEFHEFELDRIEENDPESPSILLLTSGTTASSKAVTHCHRSQLFTGLAIGSALGLTDQDTYQGAWPIYTSSVLNIACMGAWVSAAGVVLEEELSNADRLRLIETEGTTVYHGVSAPLHFLMDEYLNGRYDLSKLRRLGYGGAATPTELIDKFTTLLPWVDQVHIWAMTETGPAGTYLPPWFLPRKAGCIGVAMAGCTVQVVDEHGASVPIGEPGEIAFSGPSMALGYWRRPDATKQSFIDGWVRSGDIGLMDDEGHLHFVDRKKDIVNRGGMKISSVAVEDVIYRYPGVAEAAVVSIPHPKLGEDIAACVVPVKGRELDFEALRSHCALYLANYETPRKWILLEWLPKNALGKVLKRDLRGSILGELS
ncbi:class I adenylate-forming enzyme family protein [Marinobacter sp. 2_MG-2023]|uniref:class I adenylate-forming enzyme family protein n=1 Tax=Marinobacter sp. 2_MG-2023 TaxID=3062679 RepID=UPI0026E25A57|nr:class I adenylate-forming enzyme family protein [Marinobacter sp. 2_MG-2023]MDO6441429.1 class I adenylate-forming enzyme family protein [Marinobacter sp. 2_MG-2023]